MVIWSETVLQSLDFRVLDYRYKCNMKLFLCCCKMKSTNSISSIKSYQVIRISSLFFSSQNTSHVWLYYLCTFFFFSCSSNCHCTHSLSFSRESICSCLPRYCECFLTMPALKTPQIKYIVTETLTQVTEYLCDFSESISVSRAWRSKRHIWTFSGWQRIVTVIIKTVKVNLWFIECAACICFYVCQWYIRVYDFSPAFKNMAM